MAYLPPPTGPAGTPATDVQTVQGIPGATPIPVSNFSLPLPAGAATEAGHLATIDAKVPALGQALAATSVPIVLTAAQVAALTPPAAIVGFALEAGHLATLDTKTPALGQALAAASVPVVLTAAQVTTLTPLASVGVNNFPATQPVSAASLPLPTGAATEAGHLATIDTKTPTLGQALATASAPVVLPTAQITTLTPPAAITGFALEAGHLATLDAKLPAQGQALAAASVPVVLPAAQVTTLTPPTSVGVNNFPATQAVSAVSLPLPVSAAQDGTDSSDANATQATAGVGLRGWLSTLVSLFRAGTAKVSIRLLTATDVVTITKTYTPISTEATANTRTSPGGTTAVYQSVYVPITMPADFNPTELGLAGTLGPLTFATNGTPAGNVTLNLECQDASGRWTQIWSSGSMTANGGVGLYPSASIGSGMSTTACFTPTLRWNYIFQGVFTTASLTEQITLWGK